MVAGGGNGVRVMMYWYRFLTKVVKLVRNVSFLSKPSKERFLPYFLRKTGL